MAAVLCAQVKNAPSRWLFWHRCLRESESLGRRRPTTPADYPGRPRDGRAGPPYLFRRALQADGRKVLADLDQLPVLAIPTGSTGPTGADVGGG